MKCVHCGRESVTDRPGFGEECGGCGRYLHSCVQCRLFVPGTRRCRSSTTEQQQDYEHRNFCEEFEPSTGQVREGGDRSGDARRRFGELFGGGAG